MTLISSRHRIYFAAVGALALWVGVWGYFVPTQVDKAIPWLVPPLHARFLGAFYVSAGSILFLATFARRWETVRVMILPSVLFTTAELVATLLHLAKFSAGTAPFHIWFASYLLPPPIYLALYLWHQGRASPPVHNKPLPRWLRWSLIIGGAILTVVVILAFVFPPLLMTLFPWQLTPLTTRVLCGWPIAFGTLALSMAYENSADRVLLATPMLMIVVPALLFQMSRYASQVDWTIPLPWLGLALFALIGA